MVILNTTNTSWDNNSIKNENELLKIRIEVLNNLVNELETVNKLQKQQIDFLESTIKIENSTQNDTLNQNQMAPSYKDVAKKLIPKNVLIVKPVNSKQTSADTCKDLNRAVDPAVLSMEIEKIVPRRDGSVLINCNDAKNLDLL